ncbi:DUF411 domain-containing protein [Jiella sp. CQZ9-1]|uniref:DUF411 domain-containing protein n=2 Tax=Jiella flava TaxID=2816857 RepID=A0A939FYQ2_9HYPH|nr:DUF411 domain-containing protein [Jiella flava]
MIMTATFSGVAGLALFASPVAALSRQAMTIYASPRCGCCAAWARHVEAAGFAVSVQHLDDADLNAKKADTGIGPAFASCHTAFVDGYAIEGHVPARDIRRLLAERPDALGLAVPGMPGDAPGMGSGTTPFEVLLIKKHGTSALYARYPS